MPAATAVPLPARPREGHHQHDGDTGAMPTAAPRAPARRTPCWATRTTTTFTGAPRAPARRTPLGRGAAGVRIRRSPRARAKDTGLLRIAPNPTGIKPRPDPSALVIRRPGASFPGIHGARGGPVSIRGGLLASVAIGA